AVAARRSLSRRQQSREAWSGRGRAVRCRRACSRCARRAPGCGRRERLMNWLTNFVLPKIRAVVAKKDVPDNLWHKCPSCEQMLFYRELEANLHVCHNCSYHLRIGAELRLKIIFGEGAFTRIELPKTIVDPLKFRDRRRYAERLREGQAAFGPGSDAVVVAHGEIGRHA